MLNVVSFWDIQFEDFDDLYSIMSDWDVVCQFGGWFWFFELEFMCGWFKFYEGDGFIYGVFIDGWMVGIIGVIDGILGYCLYQDIWGQGVGIWMMVYVLVCVFGDGVFKIIVEIWEDNVGLQVFVWKFGFCYVENMVQFVKVCKVDMVSLMFELIKDDWMV